MANDSFGPKEVVTGFVTSIDRKDGISSTSGREWHAAFIEFIRPMQGAWDRDNGGYKTEQTAFKAAFFANKYTTEEDISKLIKVVREGHEVQVAGWCKVRSYKDKNNTWQTDKAISLESPEFNWQKFYELNVDRLSQEAEQDEAVQEEDDGLGELFQW